MKPVQLLGEKILLKRIDGKVYGIRDRCLHRGVQFSRKLECYTKDTLTCWYHGFTYRFGDGLLCNIVGVATERGDRQEADQDLPGEEAKGLVFVFIGDEAIAAAAARRGRAARTFWTRPAVRGMRSEVKSNWRIGCENGFDSTHIFIHRNASLHPATTISRCRWASCPRGAAPSVTVEEPGELRKACSTIRSGSRDARVRRRGRRSRRCCAANPNGGQQAAVTNLDLAALRAAREPVAGSRADAVRMVCADRRQAAHLFPQRSASRWRTPKRSAQFERDSRARWKPLALDGFNDDDIWAREATEPFYGDDYGWLREQLFEPTATSSSGASSRAATTAASSARALALKATRTCINRPTGTATIRRCGRDPHALSRSGRAARPPWCSCTVAAREQTRLATGADAFRSSRGHFTCSRWTWWGSDRRPSLKASSIRSMPAIEHLAAFRRRWGSSRAALVGNSMGGATALAWRWSEPELVDRLVLMGSAGLNAEISESLKPIIFYDYTPEGMRRLIKALTGPRFEVTEELVKFRHELSVEPDTRRAYTATMDWIRGQGGLFYEEDAIRGVTHPTLIVNGKHDLVVPLANAHRFLELLPNSWGYLIPHCGHWAMMEASTDFIAATRHFLQAKVHA